jgi:hypothetical protein
MEKPAGTFMKRNLKTGSFFLLMMKPIFLKVFLIKASNSYFPGSL